MKRLIFAVLLMSSLPVFAQPLGGVCVPFQRVTSRGVFPDFLWKCEHFTEPVAVKGIYEKGFRVVAFVGFDIQAASPSLIIEQVVAERK